MSDFWLKYKKKGQPILAMAPMAGLTDSAFRQLCKKNGADVVYTEMTSIDALYYDSKKTLEMLKMQKSEKPVVLQLFGKRPELVPKAVKLVEKAGFSGIDINFGCPARKVVAHDGGIKLLENLQLCHDLVEAVCQSTTLPVSVKTRTAIGSGKKKVTVFDFIEAIKDQPVSALMLHGRTYEGGFTGEPDYKVIKKVKEVFDGVVLGNGGINTPEEAKKMIDETGVDGLGIARGVYGRPWIFQQIKDYVSKGKYDVLDINQIKKIALQHAKLNYKEKGDFGMIELRKHLCWYFRGFPQAADLRKQLVQVETIDQLKQIFKKI